MQGLRSYVSAYAGCADGNAYVPTPMRPPLRLRWKAVVPMAPQRVIGDAGAVYCCIGSESGIVSLAMADGSVRWQQLAAPYHNEYSIMVMAGSQLFVIERPLGGTIHLDRIATDSGEVLPRLSPWHKAAVGLIGNEAILAPASQAGGIDFFDVVSGAVRTVDVPWIHFQDLALPVSETRFVTAFRTPRTIALVDKGSGHVVWSREDPSQLLPVAVAGRYLVARNLEDILPTREVKAWERNLILDAHTGELLWELPRRAVRTFSLDLATDRLIVADSRSRGEYTDAVEAWRLSTGERLWRHELMMKGVLRTGGVTPILTGGIVWLTDTDKQRAELRALDAETGEVLWSTPMKGRPQLDAVVDGCLIVRRGRSVRCYEPV